MKRILLATLLTVFSVSLMAQNKSSVVDSSDNRLTATVIQGNDIHKIALQIGLENPTIPVTCVQCYVQLPDTTAQFCKDEAGQHYLCTKTDRWASQHNPVIRYGAKGHPHELMIMLISSQSEDFSGNTGALFTLYFDGAQLPDGEHTINIKGINLVWTDLHDVRTYLVPDLQTSFFIKEGQVVPISE